jgi:hypothetical protein
MPDVRCAFGLVGQTSRRSSLSPSVSNVPGFWRRVLPAHSDSAGIRSALHRQVLGAARGADHRYRQRSSALDPVKATRRPSLVLQRFLFSRREGTFPLRSRGGHHSSGRTSLRQPRQAPARPVSRRPAMPSPNASRFTAALSSALHSHPQGLSAFVAPRRLRVPARTPTSTVAPNPGMQRTRCARR